MQPILPSIQAGSEGSETIEKQFLRLADVVVVELLGQEEKARALAIELAKQPVCGLGDLVGCEVT